ncbi:MAG: hypothetical protein EA370_02420 [Wenzhouxiangella sp.]|nr:MAG: hypothetical protein EA370_02420 [Wenzhouxiangella sp.]
MRPLRAFGTRLTLWSLGSGFTLWSFGSWRSGFTFRPLRAIGPGWPLIACKRIQRNRAGPQRLARIQWRAVDAHFQVADLLIERAGTKVQLNLEQPVCHWPVVAGLGRAHLAAATDRIEKPEFQIGRTGKRLARLLELTLVGDGGGSQYRAGQNNAKQGGQ